MDSRPTTRLTFLPYISKDQLKESDKQLQSSRRHQHTAIAAHRKRRAAKDLEKQRVPIVTAANTPNHDSSDTSSSSSAGGSSANGSSASPKLETDELWQITERTLSLGGHQHAATPMGDPRLPSPISFLDSNRFGPFNVFGDVELPSESFESFDHALVFQWPAWAMATNETAITKIRKVVVHTSMVAPYLLYSAIYAGEIYRSFLSGPTRQSDVLKLHSKQEALKHLREAMQASNGEISDEMLLAISLLAIHGSIHPSKRPRTILPLFRDNDFYSSVDMDTTHLQALRALVIQRGGLEKLALHGLRDMIAMVDIFHSLMNFTKPAFPPLRPIKALIAALQETWDDVCWRRFAQWEDGFSFLDDYPQTDGPRLHTNLRHSRILLETYGLYIRKPSQSPDFFIMIFTRRGIQHEVMMLDPQAESLVEVARVCSVVFKTEAVLALPFTGTFHQKATSLLLPALKECVAQGRWKTHPDFMLWAAVVGGFAARESVMVPEFARILSDCPVRLHRDSWAHVKMVSHRFLPFEWEMGVKCHAFWDEACDILSTSDPTRIEL